MSRKLWNFIDQCASAYGELTGTRFGWDIGGSLVNRPSEINMTNLPYNAWIVVKSRHWLLKDSRMLNLGHLKRVYIKDPKV